MVQSFINEMRAQATMSTSNRYYSSVGKITSYDHGTGLILVQIYEATPDIPALQTGWIPITSPWSGNGWGMMAAPSIGDLVEVHYQEGSLQNAWASMRFPGNGAAPLGVPAGEFWLVHKEGAFLKLTNDGKVLINSAVEIDVTTPVVKITVTTECNIDAPMVNLGNTSGPLQPVLLADSTPSVNVRAT